jgi:antitoxin component of MazEF toxin-antitoxin module
MDLVKVRKVGNSAVVTLPHSIAEKLPAGTRVLIQELDNGDLLIRRPENFEDAIRESGRRVVANHRQLLDRLAAYDPSETPQGSASTRRP